MAAIKYWVWLSALNGLGSRAAHAVVEYFGSPMEAYFAPYDSYRELPDVTERDAELLGDKDLSEAERILGECEEKNIRIMTAADADYPLRLSQIYDAPQVLYLRGKLPYLDECPAIAIVGTRKASPYGEKMASSLGYQVAKGGGVIVTGMALGNDAAAARGALMAQGKCVGVLGTAIDVDYPRQNASLIADVAATGCIMSEYPPGSGIMNFPCRNRIISGLSSGVCVVEAPLKSGALITANDALEQGRDLFVVPGNADNPNCAGSNNLLREGAKVVMTGADILEEYSGLFAVRVAEGEKKKPYETVKAPDVVVDKKETAAYIDVESRLAGCSDSQKVLLRLLGEGEKQADELIAASGFGPAKVMAEMTILGIRGLVSAKPGKRFALK